jgi:hypothetical protein
MWNEPKSETEILKTTQDMLTLRLPKDWKLVERQQGRASGKGADLIIEVQTPDGSKAAIFFEAKRKLEPRDIPRILDQLNSYGEGARIVVSAFLTPRAREILTEHGVGYGDATGNFRLTLSRPALFVETKGADRDPWSSERPLKSLKGGAAGRMVRALCDLEPPFAVRELAKRAGVSPATASRVLELLDREAIIKRDGRGVVNRVIRDELIKRWVRDYSLLKSNRADNFLEPRGVPALLTKLKAAKFRYAVTGALPASWLSATAPARMLTIFVENIPKTASAMDLRRTDTGSNVVLVEPFDDVIFERTWERNGIRCVALSQIAADLMTGPGRDPAEGEELLKRIADASSKELKDPSLLRRS